MVNWCTGRSVYKHKHMTHMHVCAYSRSYTYTAQPIGKSLRRPGNLGFQDQGEDVAAARGLAQTTQEQETPGRGGGELSGLRWGQVCPGTRSVRSGCGYKRQTLHTPHQRLEQARARGQGCRAGGMIWRASSSSLAAQTPSAALGCPLC